MSETVMLTSNPYRPMRATATRASAAAARWAFRCRVSACGCRAMTARPCPTTRSAASRSRARMCLGLLAHAREDRRRIHRRRLLQDRRRGQAGRARLRHHRRAQQGPDHQRRLQRLPGRDRGYINDMPGVAESALVGVPHPDFGEVGVAVVIAKPGAKLAAEALIGRAQGPIGQLQDSQTLLHRPPNCPATPWARCRKTCCVTVRTRVFWRLVSLWSCPQSNTQCE
jgi:hypothetical protein